MGLTVLSLSHFSLALPDIHEQKQDLGLGNPIMEHHIIFPRGAILNILRNTIATLPQLCSIVLLESQYQTDQAKLLGTDIDCISCSFQCYRIELVLLE